MYNAQINEIVSDFEKFSKTTQIRENIINWYDFKRDSHILEVGSDFGQVTKYFRNTSYKVTSIEYDVEKYEYTKKMLEKSKNINLCNEDLISYYEKNKEEKPCLSSSLGFGNRKLCCSEISA